MVSLWGGKLEIFKNLLSYNSILSLLKVSSYFEMSLLSFLLLLGIIDPNFLTHTYIEKCVHRSHKLLLVVVDQQSTGQMTEGSEC